MVPVRHCSPLVTKGRKESYRPPRVGTEGEVGIPSCFVLPNNYSRFPLICQRERGNFFRLFNYSNVSVQKSAKTGIFSGFLLPCFRATMM